VSAGSPERPVPRFDMTLRRGEARLRTRAPLPLPLGSLDALELVAGELGGPLDLRAGALALRDRRTHAVAASLSLSVRALEQALRALGLPVGLHAGALPAPARSAPRCGSRTVRWTARCAACSTRACSR
jgi:hypothetical protein